MKNILIVDRNDNACHALASQLRAHEGFRVFLEERIDTAEKLVSTLQINALVAGTGLPGGSHLFSHIRTHSPQTIAVAVAANFSSQLVTQLKAIGISHFLNKPVAVDHLVSLILQSDTPKPQSRIYGVALSSFLQLLHLEQKTCTLQVRTGPNQGLIYFMNGEVVSAQTKEETGLKAFYKIMEWNEPDINLLMECPAVSRVINLPIMHLLMESQRNKDETRSGAIDTAPGKAAPLPPKSASDGKSLALNMEELMTASPVAPRLQQMQAALYKTVGPLAKIIFRDAVKKWAESGNITSLRLPLLSRILAKEINDPEKEKAYLEIMSPPRRTP